MSNYGSYTLFTASNPTIEQLKARRAECVRMALVTYRMAHTRHPKDIQSRDYWAAQCRYWTDQAYHAHGELLAQLDAMPIINRICATAPMPLPC